LKHVFRIGMCTSKFEGPDDVDRTIDLSICPCFTNHSKSYVSSHAGCRTRRIGGGRGAVRNIFQRLRQQAAAIRLRAPCSNRLRCTQTSFVCCSNRQSRPPESIVKPGRKGWDLKDFSHQINAHPTNTSGNGPGVDRTRGPLTRPRAVALVHQKVRGFV
jgi:hypothetical protein